MKAHRNPTSCHSRHGSTMIAVMAMLPFLLIMAAMAINLSYVQSIQTKTQMVTDAATRAAGTQYATTESEAAAISAAQAIAAANPIEGITLTFTPSDFEFGVSTRSSTTSRYSFAAGGPGNAVRLSTNSFASGTGAALTPAFPLFGNDSEIRPLCTAAHTQLALDIAIVVDRSGSMCFSTSEDSMSGSPPASAPVGWNYSGPVPPNSRWLDVVDAVNGFCDELEATYGIEQASLSSYETNSATHVMLTRYFSNIRNALDDISDDFDGQATNVGDGILEGVACLNDPSKARRWATKVMVLLSDGNHNTGTDPYVAVDSAIAGSIPIYTVSFSDEANTILMEDMASMTGGNHYGALNASQLNAAFRDIARSLPSILTQ
ncbi:VWA domain-containing protein [Rubripirellula amarantea]|nr:VWA domain-containing protein [Rubripirellula amarantea]